ncbi:MAG: hypothetical protein KME64_18775 [Scytonematopsis contorta HA4267-MV1]|jgi:hypothetical protein|nr:hypothetical protein [Scytonematopsis contorta HA4267-MV1]
MYGMATIGTQNLSDYNSRTVVIEVITGGSHKNIRNSHSTLKVPYSSLSQTIGRITSRGGKIVSVSMLSSSPSDLNISTVSIKSDSELVIPEKVVIKQATEKQETVQQETVKQEKLVAEKPAEPKEAVKEVKPEEAATEPKSKSKNIAIPFKDLIPKKEKKPRSRKKSS